MNSRIFYFKNFPYRFKNRVLFIDNMKDKSSDDTYGLFIANVVVPKDNNSRFVCWTTESGFNERFKQQILNLISPTARIEYVTL